MILELDQLSLQLAAKGCLLEPDLKALQLRFVLLDCGLHRIVLSGVEGAAPELGFVSCDRGVDRFDLLRNELGERDVFFGNGKERVILDVRNVGLDRFELEPLGGEAVANLVVRVARSFARCLVLLLGERGLVGQIADPFCGCDLIGIERTQFARGIDRFVICLL